MTFTSSLAALLSAAMLTGCASDTLADSSATAASATATSAAVLAAPAGNYQTEDADASWNAQTATAIVYSGTSATVTGGGATASGGDVAITAAGTYVLSGALTDGQLTVSVSKDDLVRIVLNGVSLTCKDSAPIYVAQADKVVLVLANGTQNTVTDTASYSFADGEDEPNAAIFSKDDLSITGDGALTVSGNYKDGIASKDDLVITGGTFTVTAVEDGLRGKDSVSISNGAFAIHAGADGIKANNDTDAEKGVIVLDGGTYSITAGNDGVQAETSFSVTGGTYVIKTGSGAAGVVHTPSAQPGGGMGGGQRGGGMRPQNGANSDGATSPTPPDGAALPDDTARPQGETPPADMPQGTFQPTAASADTVAANLSAGTAAAETASDSYKALKAGTALFISGGAFTIDAQDDAVHTNGSLSVSGGTFTIDTGDDGFHADGDLTITDGTILIQSCYEGLEGATVTMSGGEIRLTASDDGVNAAGGSDGTDGADHFAQKSSYFIHISGGFLLVNASGDGLDSNGDLAISGGTVLINGPTANGDSALDYDGSCTVSGGILLAAGSAGMAQAPSDSSQQAILSITYTQPQAAGTLATLQDAGGNVILSFTPSKAYQNLMISAPSLEQGASYTLCSGGTSSGTANGGLYTAGSVTGATALTSVTLSGILTRIADDGSAVTGGMGNMGGGPGGQQRGGMNRQTTQQSQ